MQKFHMLDKPKKASIYDITNTSKPSESHTSIFAKYVNEKERSLPPYATICRCYDTTKKDPT
jgi:hypothetical protein